MIIPEHIRKVFEQGGSLLISISGGKDSDCLLEELVPYWRESGYTGKLAAIHADLGRSEWSVTQDYVKAQCARFALDLIVVSRKAGDLLDQIEKRHIDRPTITPFPSSKARYCTSDNKRTPIDAAIRQFCPTGQCVVAMGLRAEESPARAKKPVSSIRTQVTTQDRTVYDWNPIHNYTLAEIWRKLGYTLAELAEVQQTVLELRQNGYTLAYVLEYTQWDRHSAYALGNRRLSCSICILAGHTDIMNGIEFQPDYYRSLVDLELSSGKSFKPGYWLADQRPDLLTQDQREKRNALKSAHTAD